jgi:hypothetical protein
VLGLGVVLREERVGGDRSWLVLVLGQVVVLLGVPVGEGVQSLLVPVLVQVVVQLGVPVAEGVQS